MFSWVRRQIRGRKQNDVAPAITATPRRGSGSHRPSGAIHGRTPRAIRKQRNRAANKVARASRAKNRTR